MVTVITIAITITIKIHHKLNIFASFGAPNTENKHAEITGRVEFLGQMFL